jgi:hypothetical protein
MPDLLTHALLGYSLGTVLSWRYGWLEPRYVSVVMAGVFLPDLAKVELVLPGALLEAHLGVPFDWYGVHTAGGALLALLVGVVLVPTEERRRVFALLSLGAASHLVADAFLLKASGRSSPLLWALTDYAPPTPGIYLSSDVWPSVVFGALALALWILDRTVVRSTTTGQ